MWRKRHLHILLGRRDIPRTEIFSAVKMSVLPKCDAIPIKISEVYFADIKK